MKKILLCLAIIIIGTNVGCGTFFKNMGKNVVAGATEKTDSLARTIVAGARDELTSHTTKVKAERFIDSILTSLKDSLNPEVAALRDTIFNPKVIKWSDSLVEALTGKKVRLNVQSLQAAFVGKSKKDIQDLLISVKAAINDITDTTTGKVALLRDELLGPKTDSAINRIVAHAMDTITKRIVSDINPQLRGDVSLINQYATSWLLLMGGIAVVIIFLIWWNRRRYIKMVALLTKHIHNIPDENVYDKVTAKIKDEAITTGLEPSLRKILQKNGMLGEEQWKLNIKKKGLV
jgi:hypothetical protein